MNSLFIINPIRLPFGVWVFDDETTGLVREPFVGQTNTLIDRMAKEAGIPLRETSEGVGLVFGATPFPDYHCELILEETDPTGSTYTSEKYQLKPWLCPAMFKYFPQAPAVLYGMVKKLDK